MTAKLERRFAAATADSAGTVTGVAMAYGAPAWIGSFRETIRPGAFAPIGEIRATLQHDRAKPLAVNRDGGGLVLDDGPERLAVSLDLPAYGDGPGAAELVARGVLSGFSVEMIVDDEAWSGRDREIRSARLVGLSLVDRPAHSAAVAALEARWILSRGTLARRPLLLDGVFV